MNSGKLLIKIIFLLMVSLVSVLPVYAQIPNLEPDSNSRRNLIFEHYKRQGKLFVPDTTVVFSVHIFKKDYWNSGYLEGRFRGVSDTHYFFQTDQIFHNCNFENIYFKEISSGKYIASVNKDYLLEIYGSPKSKPVHSVSEVLAWGSAVIVLFSPLLTIDYKKGEFLEKRYFAINRIALPVFAASLSLYLASDSRKIRISNKPDHRQNRLYRHQE